MLKEDINVSVIITNYNKGTKILDAHRSVIFQLNSQDELIVIDDHSDCTESKKCLTYLRNNGARVIINDFNSGVSYSKNKGVSLAKNDIIVLLDGDDALTPSALLTIKQAFRENPNAWLVYGDYIRNEIGNSKQTISCRLISTNEGNLEPSSLAKNWTLLGTSPFKRSKCFSITSFDTRFNRTDDVDFHRRLITTKGFSANYINTPIYQWNVEKGGNNSNIPHIDILMSHLSGFSFFYKYLSKPNFILFLFKLIYRLMYTAILKLVTK